MKISKVILACTNDHYYDYYEVVSKAWKELGIQPVLFLIGDQESNKKDVIDIRVDNIDKVFASQAIRLLGPALFREENCIISDIDMMPMSDNYFVESLKNIAEGKFVLMRDGVTSNNMYPICYNVAKGKIWEQIFEVDSIKSINLKLTHWFEKYFNNVESNWYIDQIILKKKLDKFYKDSESNFIKLNDKDTNFRRLNRTDLGPRFKKFYNPLEEYTDFHMPIPYKKNKKIITKVFNLNFE
jgi:hypothetical protein